MILSGLDNIDVIAWREPAADEYILLADQRILKGPLSIKGLVIRPATGFAFQYDVNSDGLRLISTEGVIPSAALAALSASSAAPATSLTFQQAFDALQRDHAVKIARAPWKDHWLEWDVAHYPTLADVYATGARASWSHLRTDLIARDWMVVTG